MLQAKKVFPTAGGRWLKRVHEGCLHIGKKGLFARAHCTNAKNVFSTAALLSQKVLLVALCSVNTSKKKLPVHRQKLLLIDVSTHANRFVDGCLYINKNAIDGCLNVSKNCPLKLSAHKPKCYVLLPAGVIVNDAFG